jgi:hypothetical protein
VIYSFLKHRKLTLEQVHLIAEIVAAIAVVASLLYLEIANKK